MHGKEAGKTPSGSKYVAPMWDFKPGGKCGTEVSDLFPHIRECMDDICLIRSMHGGSRRSFSSYVGSPYGLRQRGAAQHGILGELPAWERKPEPAVLRRPRTEIAVRPAARFGVRIFCRVAIREPGCWPVRNRYRI